VVSTDPDNTENSIVSLKKLARHNELHESRKSLIFKNLVVCLNNLHEAGVSHLSIDPDRIWIEDMFYVYLGPFRLSRNLGSSHLAFMPPESILSDKTVDQSLVHKCDIWSLGMIFCCIRLGNKFVAESMRVTSLDDYLLFVHFLVGIPVEEHLSYIGRLSISRLTKLLEGKERTSASFDVKYIQQCGDELRHIEILSYMLHFEPSKRIDCGDILKFDLFRESPKVPTTREEYAFRSNENYEKFNRSEFNIAGPRRSPLLLEKHQETIKQSPNEELHEPESKLVRRESKPFYKSQNISYDGNLKIKQNVLRRDIGTSHVNLIGKKECDLVEDISFDQTSKLNDSKSGLEPRSHLRKFRENSEIFETSNVSETNKSEVRNRDYVGSRRILDRRERYEGGAVDFSKAEKQDRGRVAEPRFFKKEPEHISSKEEISKSEMDNSVQKINSDASQPLIRKTKVRISVEINSLIFMAK
jgi:serine/threonine protein kinase